MPGGIIEQGELPLPGAHAGRWAVGPGSEADQIVMAIIWQCPLVESDNEVMQYTAVQLMTDPGRDQWIDRVKELGDRLQCTDAR